MSCSLANRRQRSVSSPASATTLARGSSAYPSTCHAPMPQPTTPTRTCSIAPLEPFPQQRPPAGARGGVTYVAVQHGTAPRVLQGGVFGVSKGLTDGRPSLRYDKQIRPQMALRRGRDVHL